MLVASYMNVTLVVIDELFCVYVCVSVVFEDEVEVLQGDCVLPLQESTNW